MEINISKFLGFLTGLLVVASVIGTGYILYTVFFTGAEVATSPSLDQVSPSLFGPKTSKAAATLVDKTQQIALSDKDILFTKGSIYLSFTETPESIPLSDSRGRPDPFLPLDTYAAP